MNKIAAVEKFAGKINAHIIINGANILIDTSLKSDKDFLYFINCLTKKIMMDSFIKENKNNFNNENLKLSSKLRK